LVAVAIAAGWMGASITQAPPPSAQSPRDSVPRPIGSPAAMPRAENLRQRLADPPLPSPGRNPFVYGPRVARPMSYRDRENAPVAAPPVPAEPPPPALPVFKLSGIASNVEGGTTVLTAIVNDNGSMVFVKAGDKLSRGYSVVRVEEMSVTLVDADGVTQTIRLP
jgi:hypothetical protein